MSTGFVTMVISCGLDDWERDKDVIITIPLFYHQRYWGILESRSGLIIMFVNGQTG